MIFRDAPPTQSNRLSTTPSQPTPSQSIPNHYTPINLDSFDVSITPDSPLPTISLQERLNFTLFPGAEDKWKELRSLEGRRVVLELRARYNEQLLQTGHYPNWTVRYDPQANLLNTQQAVDEVIAHRQNQANQNLERQASLYKIEAERVKIQAEAALAGLNVLYNKPEAINYNFNEALNAIVILTERTRDIEWRELNRRWSAIHAAPLAALWEGIPPQYTRPPAATPPQSVNLNGTLNTSMGQQVFQGRGSGTPGPHFRQGGTRGRGGYRGNRARGRFIPYNNRQPPPQPQQLLQTTSTRGRGWTRGNPRGNRGTFRGGNRNQAQIERVVRRVCREFFR